MKYCAKCGSLIEEGANVCTECGAPVNVQPVQQVNNNQQGYYQQPAYNPYYQQPSQMDKDVETANTLGIISLVASIIGFGIIFIGALVCGIIGMSKIKPYMNEKTFPNDKARSAYSLNKAGVIIVIVKFGIGVLFAIGWIIFMGVVAGTAVHSPF